MSHFSTSGELMFRTIWISDVHLGWSACRAERLLDFLRYHESENLYLVGDMIDGWQLKKGWLWKQSYNDVIQKLLRRARKGSRVVYIPGNHDDFARQYVGHRFGGIEVCRDTIHVTAKGERLLVIHGDEFDGVVTYTRWMQALGNYAYDAAIKFNRVFNWFRKRLGMPYWSLSQHLKHKVKNAMMFVSKFEEALVCEARRRGVDGVVCGHIHRPAIQTIDGLAYYNTGDWIESCTALVEHFDGRIEILPWFHERIAKHTAAEEQELTAALPT
jgi:UDP-2,3-diacylglucosamine pyrophosphatase LpxH